jgi:uncharacterized protein (DUF1800 family)
LDNYLSTREIPLENRPDLGLNENYARELLELFTVGVAADYTLKDIQNAAKVLTGWSITRPRSGVLEYRFYPELHERGNKKVFGKTFRFNGEKEGIALLRYLSLRPETAQHIAYKLTAYFIADEPPAELVSRITEVFLETEGDIPAMLREALLSPEFNRRRFQKAKTKTPLRYFISALRATEAEIRDALPLVRPFNNLGQPLFQCQPPTGYSHIAEEVLSAGVFLSENSLSRLLAFNRLRGIGLSAEDLVPADHTGRKLADTLMERILFLPSEDTARIVRKAAGKPGIGVRELMALILVSPDFYMY